MAMLEAVYVDHKEAKAVVAIQPKPASSDHEGRLWGCLNKRAS